jgi:Flp pilus assembly protein TadD
MLQDLERRRYEKAETGPDDLILGLRPSGSGTQRRQVFWWLGGVTLVLLTGGIGWGYANLPVDEHRPIPTGDQIPQTLEPMSQPLPAADTPYAQPSSSLSVEPKPLAVEPEAKPQQLVKRIELRRTGQEYSLELEFDQPLALPPLHYRQDGQLWLQLFATEVSQVRLPPLQDGVPIMEWQAYLEAGHQMIGLRLQSSYQAELKKLHPRVWALHLYQRGERVSRPRQAQPSQVQVEQEPQTAHDSRQSTQADKASSAQSVRVARSDDGFSAAQQALAKGQQQRAEKLLRQLLAQQPGHQAASLLLSRIYLTRDDPAGAEAVILTALQQHPDQPELVTHFTRCLVAEDRLSEAADYLLKAMRNDYAPHVGLLATIMQRQQRHRQARDYFLQALQLNPQEVTWLAGLGISQEQLGEMGGARQAYQRALSSGRLNLTLQGFVEGRLSEMSGSGD